MDSGDENESDPLNCGTLNIEIDDQINPFSDYITNSKCSGSYDSKIDEELYNSRDGNKGIDILRFSDENKNKSPSSIEIDFFTSATSLKSNSSISYDNLPDPLTDSEAMKLAGDTGNVSVKSFEERDRSHHQNNNISGLSTITEEKYDKSNTPKIFTVKTYNNENGDVNKLKEEMEQEEEKIEEKLNIPDINMSKKEEEKEEEFKDDFVLEDDDGGFINVCMDGRNKDKRKEIRKEREKNRK